MVTKNRYYYYLAIKTIHFDMVYMVLFARKCYRSVWLSSAGLPSFEKKRS